MRVSNQKVSLSLSKPQIPNSKHAGLKKPAKGPLTCHGTSSNAASQPRRSMIPYQDAMCVSFLVGLIVTMTV